MCRVLVGRPEGNHHLEDQGVDGRMDQMDLRENGCGVESIHLVQDRDCWWAVLNVVMNLRVLVPQS
jgi:hypothetical protein